MASRDLDRREFLKAAGVAGAAWGGSAKGDATSDGGGRSWADGNAPYVHQQIPDVAVIGGGAFGMFSALSLRQEGADVTLIDQYGPGNSRATSGGETRGVRSSYGDRPADGQWTRWAARAIERWNELNEEWKDLLIGPLFYHTGDLMMREEDSPNLQSVRDIWDRFGVPYEVLDADEIEYRWPVIRTNDVGYAMYEPGAGVVRARRACETAAKMFQLLGGQIKIAKALPGHRAGARQWDIELTPGGRVRAGQYVWALGMWFPKILPDLMGRRVRGSMGHVVYFGTPPGDNRFTFPNLPSYGVPGCTGWPALPPDNRGFRVRTGGRQGDDPDISPRRLDAEHIERPRQVLRDWFPDLEDAPVIETRACHYTSSVSRNFIIDREPGMENVWIAGCGNAESFKQAPLLGDYIARRVLGMETNPDDDEAFAFPEEEYDPNAGRGRGGGGGGGRSGGGGIEADFFDPKEEA